MARKITIDEDRLNAIIQDQIKHAMAAQRATDMNLQYEKKITALMAEIADLRDQLDELTKEPPGKPEPPVDRGGGGYGAGERPSGKTGPDWGGPGYWDLVFEGCEAEL